VLVDILDCDDLQKQTSSIVPEVKGKHTIGNKFPHPTPTPHQYRAKDKDLHRSSFWKLLRKHSKAYRDIRQRKVESLGGWDTVSDLIEQITEL
jgi:hypothetical protein